jgi:hypothetical protein
MWTIVLKNAEIQRYGPGFSIERRTGICRWLVGRWQKSVEKLSDAAVWSRTKPPDMRCGLRKTGMVANRFAAGQAGFQAQG